jgi:hypothetical protein
VLDDKGDTVIETWDKNTKTWVKTDKIKRKASTDKLSGALTENQVVQSLTDLAAYKIADNESPEDKFAEFYKKYRDLVKKGASREDAYGQIFDEASQVLSTTKSTTPATPATTGSYKSLWSK